MQNEGIKVKFKVTKLTDSRATNSSLEIGNSYEGNYFMNNNSIQWTDPKNAQEWTFWVGDTCELIDTQKQIIKNAFDFVREKMKNVGVVTSEISPEYCLKYGKPTADVENEEKISLDIKVHRMGIVLNAIESLRRNTPEYSHQTGYYKEVNPNLFDLSSEEFDDIIKHIVGLLQYHRNRSYENYLKENNLS